MEPNELSPQEGHIMAKKERIVRYSMDEIKALLEKEGARTDYTTPTDYAEVERQIATDPDLAVPDNWEDIAFVGLPPFGKNNKHLVSLRYSPRVIEYFRSTGRGWQSRMDAVLCAFVDRQSSSNAHKDPR